MKKRNWRPLKGRIAAALRAHGGEIAYYACVALALAAIAVAAERYRVGGEARQTPSLPTVEFSAPEEEPAEEGPRAPRGAQLLRGFAEAPAWNAALGLWESHPATDYRPDGGAVECLCAGVVRAVGESGRWGGFVEVEGGGLLLRYASIAPREGLKPGDALAVGDGIGVADGSMPGESGLGAHLHLEAYRDGRAVDFAGLAAGD